MILRLYVESQSGAREKIREYSDVLRKYVDETYHIENDCLFALDVRQYNIVSIEYAEDADDFVKQEILKYSINEAV